MAHVILVAATWSTAGMAIARRGGVTDFTKDGQPNIQSAAALVIDLQTNQILYEKDPDVIRPLASISKLMAALVIHSECNLNPDELHEMSPANRDAAKGGDKTKLTTGWKYTHRDLLHAALMRSDNRAMPALGEACKLDAAQLAERMNLKAKSLGLRKTTFKEPNGLSKENVSTPREIMVFLREAIKVPELAEIMNTSEYTITAVKDGRPSRKIDIHSTDRLLGKDIAQILGGKTGYTDLAKYCLAIAARTPESRELGMVFLGAEGKGTRFADFSRVVKWMNKAMAIAKEKLHAPALLQADKAMAEPAQPPAQTASSAEPGVVRTVSKAQGASADQAPAPAPAGAEPLADTPKEMAW